MNLANHFLIAMPDLSDELFGRSVIYICDHTDRGALGLIINKPGSIRLADLFSRVDLPLPDQQLAEQFVFHGGPVQTERGFVLHDWPAEDGDRDLESGGAYASTLNIPGGLRMTTSRDVLEALAVGRGPARVLITLGYSAWEGGQLESEIAANHWLVMDADSAVIFDARPEKRYALAMDLLGIRAWQLAPQSGRA